MKPFKTRPAGIGTNKMHGFCIECSAPATTEALFQLEDAVVLQRYCDKHIVSANYTISRN